MSRVTTAVRSASSAASTSTCVASIPGVASAASGCRVMGRLCQIDGAAASSADLRSRRDPGSFIMKFVVPHTLLAVSMRSTLPCVIVGQGRCSRRGHDSVTL